MNILEQVSLKNYSTMRLGGTARYACEVFNEQDILEAVEFAHSHHLPLRVIGTGSNIIWRDEGFAGLLIINKVEGFELDDSGTVVQIGAGMQWDAAVQKTVDLGLSGLEFLSLIPGTTGATPIQNVGAYGQEIKNVLLSVRSYDLHLKKFVTIPNDQCGFAYRTSRFKTEDSGRFIISSITLQLSKETPQPPFYESLQSYFDQNQIRDIDVAKIRGAVIAIRQSKLPDPAKVANNGSFFANPIIDASHYETLKNQFADIKAWPAGEQYKIAAGWLVEQAGFSDFHDAETGMATWAAQNLVIVNEHASSTQDLLDFKQKIVQAVAEKFGISLEQEPELLP